LCPELRQFTRAAAGQFVSQVPVTRPHPAPAAILLDRAAALHRSVFEAADEGRFLSQVHQFEDREVTRAWPIASAQRGNRLFHRDAEVREWVFEAAHPNRLASQAHVTRAHPAAAAQEEL
jgi:hypothetical protein